MTMMHDMFVLTRWSKRGRLTNLPGPSLNSQDWCFTGKLRRSCQRNWFVDGLRYCLVFLQPSTVSCPESISLVGRDKYLPGHYYQNNCQMNEELNNSRLWCIGCLRRPCVWPYPPAHLSFQPFCTSTYFLFCSYTLAYKSSNSPHINH